MPVTPGSCGVGEAMPRPSPCTEGYSLGYSMMQETVPKPPALVWRMLPALVIGKDEAPSPTSLVAVGWQSWGGWRSSVGICGVGVLWAEAEGEKGQKGSWTRSPPFQPQICQGRYLESRVISFTHNIIKEDSGAGWGILTLGLSH